MSLFNEAEKCQDHKAEEPTEETFTAKAYVRKKKPLTKRISSRRGFAEIAGIPACLRQVRRYIQAIGKKLVCREMLVISRQVKILTYYTVT